MILQFFAPGVPYPKGSYAPIVVKGRLITRTDANLERWNSLVRAGARRVAPAAPFNEPIALSLEFVLPRKRGNAHASLHALPDVVPDLDKLARAVGDALIKIIYTDDARVVRLVAEKRWAHAEETTGCLITVEKVVPQLTMEI